jgi:RNA polymerase sigma-70 factor, ECF subfamily
MWTTSGFTISEPPSVERGLRSRSDRDRELVDWLRQRDPRAAERLLHVYGDRAYRLAVRITRMRPDAEEVVQDALLTVVRKIDSFRGDAAFGSWVYRIVANTAYQKIRGRRRRQGEISADAVPGALGEGVASAGRLGDWSVAVENPARQTEVRVALTRAIDELPLHYRTIFVLRDLHGLSHVEIGRRLSLSAANVKTRIHRARSLLRERLAETPTTPTAPRYPVAV